MENIDRRITIEDIDTCVKTIVDINIKTDASLITQYKIIKSYINSFEKNEDKIKVASTLVDKYTFYLVDNVFKDSTEDLKQRLVTILKHKGAYLTDSEFASTFSDYGGGRDTFNSKFHIFLISLFTFLIKIIQVNENIYGRG
jgi:hypothetical protein